jgi:hypothetical protein
LISLHARTAGRNLEVNGDYSVNEELIGCALFAMEYGGTLDLTRGRIMERNISRRRYPCTRCIGYGSSDREKRQFINPWIYHPEFGLGSYEASGLLIALNEDFIRKETSSLDLTSRRMNGD